MIWKCNASKVLYKKTSKVLTSKGWFISIKKGTNFGGHRVIVFNLARPTRYPWYKEKFPALKDTDLHKLRRKERFCFIFY